MSRFDHPELLRAVQSGTVNPYGRCRPTGASVATLRLAAAAERQYRSTDCGTPAVFGCPFYVRRSLLLPGLLLTTMVVVGTCNRTHRAEDPKLPDPEDVRSSR